MTKKQKVRQTNNQAVCDKRRGNKGGEEKRNWSIIDSNLSPHIKSAVAGVKKKLHQTKGSDNPTEHRAYVCIVCDYFIPLTEPLRTMNRTDLMDHKHCLGVSESKTYHGVKLHNALKTHYHV